MHSEEKVLLRAMMLQNFLLARLRMIKNDPLKYDKKPAKPSPELIDLVDYHIDYQERIKKLKEQVEIAYQVLKTIPKDAPRFSHVSTILQKDLIELKRLETKFHKYFDLDQSPVINAIVAMGAEKLAIACRKLQSEIINIRIDIQGGTKEYREKTPQETGEHAAKKDPGEVASDLLKKTAVAPARDKLTKQLDAPVFNNPEDYLNYFIASAAQEADRKLDQALYDILDEYDRHIEDNVKVKKPVTTSSVGVSKDVWARLQPNEQPTLPTKAKESTLLLTGYTLFTNAAGIFGGRAPALTKMRCLQELYHTVPPSYLVGALIFFKDSSDKVPSVSEVTEKKEASPKK